MKREPDVHDTDPKDYEASLEQWIDPEKVKWLDEFRNALRELGFDEWSTEDVIDDKTLTLRFDLDPEDFAESLRFCPECEWTGVVEELHKGGRCPDCGEKI